MKKWILLSLSLMLMLSLILSMVAIKPKESKIAEPSKITDNHLFDAQVKTSYIFPIEVLIKKPLKQPEYIERILNLLPTPTPTPTPLPKQKAKVKNEVEISSFKELPNDLTEYIRSLSEEFLIDFNLIVAIIHQETGGEFKPKLTHRNKDGTKDFGLMQLNDGGTLQWLSKESGIDNFDWSNPKHSIRAGVWYLNYLKEQWIKDGYGKNRNLIKLVALSYNMGYSGAISYIKNHDVLNKEYVIKVIKFANNM